MATPNDTLCNSHGCIGVYVASCTAAPLTTKAMVETHQHEIEKNMDIHSNQHTSAKQGQK
jgi:hypothetical protein